jgi:hypothetical protein
MGISEIIVPLPKRLRICGRHLFHIVARRGGKVLMARRRLSAALLLIVWVLSGFTRSRPRGPLKELEYVAAVRARPYAAVDFSFSTARVPLDI